MPKSKQGHEINSQGRQCSKCGEWKPWLKADGVPNFWRHPARASGFDNQCADCRKAARDQRGRKKKLHVWTECQRCGEDIEPGTARLCDPCRDRSHRWIRGSIYLVLDGVGEFNKGGHFSPDDFERSLRAGYWPSGMVVEKWSRRTYAGTFRVEGLKLVPVEQAPIGDGVYLGTPEVMNPAKDGLL